MGFMSYQSLVYQERLIAFDKENKHTSYIAGKETFMYTNNSFK